MADIKQTNKNIDQVEPAELLVAEAVQLLPEVSIRSKIAKLIDVKSITTFSFVAAFIASVFLDKQSPELSEITRTIVIFFFGSKYGSSVTKEDK